ncbi:hypothetical protein TRM7557_00389 [Tritonibacter multivorans]|uniref:Histidine kinase n=1 Tax=Tritonibacter multivorans TaxID=928856 RepID=A0A0P1G1L4_9RHOB|nr:DUF6446 family protein [Tritonibacter multivorans]MDA7419428.1 DUF6446 family protein [Tritonibacter multivorans]CUH75442.1 hypothetical protein TRM7557_00389 [Tritonibacter multivorans]SFC67555.1 hypothetical protein SAMN04488049_103395 [Tritonibacter multivorans]
MTGKLLSVILILSGLLAGAAMYYLQVYGFYQSVDARPGQDVVLLPLGRETPQAIQYSAFEAIDADSSPIRYRACFETTLRADELAQLYTLSETQDPRNAPGWFDCFDAAALGAALKDGSATAFMGQKNIEFGVDRIVAITNDGRGFVWHELNNCGKKAYDGTVVGEVCPERPETH